MFENIKLPSMKLPWWMSGKELTKLKNAAIAWFNLVVSWAKWPLQQTDPLTCDEGILKLIAWQRDITRYAGEPLQLFRKRVAYAFVNARDAGSTIGFIKICERLDIGHVLTEERIQGIDWDIINIYLDDEQLADNPELLKTIIRQYGRTCRRYNFLLETPVTAYMRCGEVANCFATAVAILPEKNSVIRLQIHERGLNRETISVGLPILPPKPPEPVSFDVFARGYEVQVSRATLSAGLPILPPKLPEPVSFDVFARGYEVQVSRATLSAGLPILPPKLPEPVSFDVFARGYEKALTRKTSVAVLHIPEQSETPFLAKLIHLAHEVTLSRATVMASITEQYAKLKTRSFAVATNNSTFVASLSG